MTESEIVRQMLDTLNGEGTEAALAWFAEDFHGVVPPELSAEPDSYDGHDGVRRYFDSFHEIVDDLRFDAEELVDVAPNAVAGRGLITGRGRQSGIPIEMRLPLLIRLRDGKLIEMSPYEDWDEAVAAAKSPG
jgi:ketosteroid isomerase-like protein